VSLKEETTYRI